MKLEDLAALMKISKEELIEQFKQNNVIELKLTEKIMKTKEDKVSIEVLS